MRTKEQLKAEIRVLMIEYAKAKAEISRDVRAGRTLNSERLACAAHEILVSICHRQGILVQMLEVEHEYKEAA